CAVSRYHQILAVACGPRSRRLAAHRAPVAYGGDAGAGDQDRSVREDAGVARAGVRDHVPAADQQIHGAHSRAASFSMMVRATLVSWSARPAAIAACW